MCFFQVVAKLVKFEQQNYASAGAIANEVLSAIRTVAAFGGEGKAVERWAWLQSRWGSGAMDGVLALCRHLKPAMHQQLQPIIVWDSCLSADMTRSWCELAGLAS